MTGPDDPTTQMPTPEPREPQQPEEPPAPPADAPTPTPTPTPTTTAARQPSLAMVGGFIAIIGLGVIAWLVFLSGLFGGDPDPSPTPTASASASASAEPSEVPSAEPSEAPTEAPTATPMPSADAGPFEVAWTAATGVDADAQISAVKFLDGRWIAVGGVFADEAVEAAIWTSDDGASWTAAEIDSTRAANEATAVTDVSELDGTLVAIGSWGIVPSDQRSWMTWTSTDGGATWTESREGPTGAALSAIAPGGPGLVAAGWNFGGITPFDSYFASSADGITWELAGGTIDDGAVQDLAVLGDRIVAVGATFRDTGANDATAWYSDDGGDTWTAVDVPDGGNELSMVDLVPFGDGLAAIGNGGDSSVPLFVSAAWTTTDGETWEIFEVASGATANGVGAVDGGLVAVGNFAAHDLGPGVAWTSTDAATWVEGGELGDGSVRLSAAGGEGDVVVAGGQCQSESCDAVIWVGEVTR